MLLSHLAFLSFALIPAVAPSQDTPPPHKFSLAIYTDKFDSQDGDAKTGGTYWRITSLKEDWTIERGGWTNYKESTDPPPIDKYPGPPHLLQAVFHWDHTLEPRAFWIDKTKDPNSPFRDMMKCTIRPPVGMQKMVYLYIAYQKTVDWVDKVDKDTLKPGWLHCGDGPDFDHSLFINPKSNRFE